MERDARRDTAPLPDVVRPGIRLLVVGINPGSRSAALGCHYAGHGNRFWPALYAAGITPTPLSPADQWQLPELGVGLTNLVARETARASELSAAELRTGAGHLLELVDELAPRAVAVLGVTAYRTAFAAPRAVAGEQPSRGDEDETAWFALHNPSGLNAHATPAIHAAGLRVAAEAAGLTLHRSGNARPNETPPRPE